MPIARFQMPDGRVARFEVPEGTTPEQAQAMIEASLQQQKGPEQSAAYKEGGQLPGALRGLANVMQGPTFGFADEIGGAVGGAISALKGNGYSKGYQDTRDTIRGAADAESKNNPIFSGVTQAMASAPSMIIGGAGNLLFKGASIAPRIGNAAVVGAGAGALSGAGNSTAEDATGVAKDAAIGGVLGAGTSAAVVPVGSVLGAVGRNVGSRFSNGVADRYAAEKVAEALSRDARGSVVQTSLTAPLNQALARYQKLGPEARVVDAGGQNTRALLDTLAILPGRAKEATEAAIHSRQAGRADRMRGAAQDGLDQSGARLVPTIDELLAKRSTDAAPIYDALYKRGVFINEDLRGIIDAAHKLGAGGEAKRIAIAKQTDYGLTPDTKWAGVRELDYLKQGLDDIIAANKNEFGKLNKVGAAVQGLKADLVSILDQETKGLYRKAREAYAGPSALIEAAQEGRMFLARDDTAIAKSLSTLSQSEQEAYRLGAFEALRSKLGTPGGQTEVLGMWKNKTMQERLKELFPDERAFRKFAVTVAQESRLKGLEQVGRGSQTAPRQFAVGDLDTGAITDAGGMLGGASSGNIPQFLLGAKNLWNRAQTPEPVRDAMAGLLMQNGPAGHQGLLGLENTMRMVNAARAGRANQVGMGAGLLTPTYQQYLQ